MAQSPAEPPTSEGLREPTPLASPSRRSLKVLQLSSGNIFGGVESLQLTLAECRQLCPDLDQSFALTFDSEFAARLRRSGAKVHLLPQVRLRHLPSIHQSRHELRSLFNEFQFDVVISHSTWIQTIFGDLVHHGGAQFFFWMHNPFDGHWLQRLASFHPPDFAICNSQFTQSTLDRCYPRVPSAVMHLPVQARTPARTRETVRRELGLAPDEVAILCAARIERWKGQHNLIRAARRISTSLPWRIFIAGAPNRPSDLHYFEALKSEAASSPASNRIQFLGFRADIPDLLAACDIYCQANEQPEPFGIAFVEALQAGVPVVTYDMGGPREILDSSTGILVPPGDLDGIAAALNRLSEDRALRLQLGTAGPARANALCDPARQMQILTDTVRSVVGRPIRVTAG